MTSFTPRQATPGRSFLRKAVQKVSASDGPISTPKDLPTGHRAY